MSALPTSMAEAMPRAELRGARGVALLVALALVAGAVWAFVAEPFAIPSGSMEPTLRPGDQVLVNKLAYRQAAPQRGDLAVFSAPDTHKVTLKRVVGVAGDRVAIEDGVLTVNRRPVREAYVDYSRVDSVYFGPVVVPHGSVFALGDNRGDSHDSRDFGAVPDHSLIGKVLVRFWSPR